MEKLTEEDKSLLPHAPHPPGQVILSPTHPPGGQAVLSLNNMISLDPSIHLERMVERKYQSTANRLRTQSADVTMTSSKQVRFREENDMRVRQIYNNHGIRVKMVAHKKSPVLHRNPIVCRILDNMAQKYQDQFGGAGGGGRVIRTLSAQNVPGNAPPGPPGTSVIEIPELVRWYKQRQRDKAKEAQQQQQQQSHGLSGKWVYGQRVHPTQSLTTPRGYDLRLPFERVNSSDISLPPFLTRTQSDLSPLISATTASAGPYSSDLLNSYNSENSRLSQDEAHKGSQTDRQTDRLTDGRRASKGRRAGEDGGLRELRPGSRKNSKPLSVIANGKGSSSSNGLDKEQRDPRYSDTNNSAIITNGHSNNKDCASRLKDDSFLPPAGNGKSNTSGANYTSNGFRPLNSRNNFLGGQQISPQLPAASPARPPQFSSNTTSSSHSRDSEDLVATGTNPLPPTAPNNSSSTQPPPSSQAPPMGGPTQGRRGGASQTNGVQSTQSSGALGGGNGSSSSSSTVSRKMYNGASSKVLGPAGRNSRDLIDPKYSDPLPGAPASFQQRLAEINSLEQETLRYERAKKFKKKTKTDS